MNTITDSVNATNTWKTRLSSAEARPIKTRLATLSLLLGIGIGVMPTAHAQEPTTVPFPALAAAPTVDGDLSDWQGASWQRITVKPAELPAKAGEKSKTHPVGTLDVELSAGVHANKVYLAVRWPDEHENTDYRIWRWQGKRYRRGKQRDDQFAIRFFMEGDYNACMISANDYKVDVWLWSAGRTNPIGHADDFTFIMSTKMIDNAAEYQDKDDKTVYIKRFKDAGSELYETHKPGKKFIGKKVDSVILTEKPSGSRADVAARGVWKDGYWHLELQRKLDTGHADDVALSAGKEILGSIAVFNKSGAEHKSVSGTLRFKL